MDKVKTKGFITLAVGKQNYYELANNLLHSYRATNKDNLYPWTIVCDRENEFTNDFDSVILLKNPSMSYIDKLNLFSMCPYDETIFIDADCLIFGDLTDYWEIFKKVDGFSCFGKSLPLNSSDGWFLLEDTGKWKSDITFIPQMHGGICFISRGEKLNQILKKAEEIKETYYCFKFKYFSDPADEPIMALAMAAESSHPVEFKNESYVFLPVADKLNTIRYIKDRDHITFTKNGISSAVNLVHFQNHNTLKADYKLLRDSINNNSILELYSRYICYRVIDLSRPVFRKIARIFQH